MAANSTSQVVMHSIPMDNFDELSAKLAILHANLQLIHGEGAENFQTFSDKLKDTYLWGCATLAGEALALISSTGVGGYNSQATDGKHNQRNV